MERHSPALARQPTASLGAYHLEETESLAIGLFKKNLQTEVSLLTAPKRSSSTEEKLRRGDLVHMIKLEAWKCRKSHPYSLSCLPAKHVLLVCQLDCLAS